VRRFGHERYARDQDGSSLAAETLYPRVIVLFSLLVAGFLGLALARDAVNIALALSPHGVLHGKIWQLLTYPFLNDPMGLIGNGMVILFLGSAIEREWRTASFLLLWLVVTVTCGLLWIVLNLLMGYSMAGMGPV